MNKQLQNKAPNDRMIAIQELQRRWIEKNIGKKEKNLADSEQLIPKFKFLLSKLRKSKSLLDDK